MPTSVIQVAVEMDDGSEVSVKVANLVLVSGSNDVPAEIARAAAREGMRVWLKGLVTAAELIGVCHVYVVGLIVIRA